MSRVHGNTLVSVLVLSLVCCPLSVAKDAPETTANGQQPTDQAATCDGQACYPGAYGAGPDPTRCNKHPSFYSPFRYWTPAAARVYDYVCGPKLSAYSPNRRPEIPVSFYTQKTRCPAVPPWEMIIERPMAPESSQTRYILGPR